MVRGTSASSMASTSNSRRSDYEYDGPVKYCYCNVRGCKLKAPLKTSWTDENPGRRFFSCRNYSVSKFCKCFYDYLEKNGG